MKFARLITVVLIAVFGLSIQLDAGIKKSLKNEIKKNDSDTKGKKAIESKYDLVLNEKSDMDADIKKLLPAKSKITHWITNGIFGPADGTKGPIMIVPYITEGSNKILLMLLIPAEPGKYNKMMLGEIKIGTSTASEVYSVFFDQADKDKERELFILCSSSKDKNGVYTTAVYDFNKNGFKRVPAIEAKLKNLYPTINVRRALRAMENSTTGKKSKK